MRKAVAPLRKACIVRLNLGGDKKHSFMEQNTGRILGKRELKILGLYHIVSFRYQVRIKYTERTYGVSTKKIVSSTVLRNPPIFSMPSLFGFKEKSSLIALFEGARVFDS